MRFSWELVLVMIYLYSAFGSTDTVDPFVHPTEVSWNATIEINNSQPNMIPLNGMCQPSILDALCYSQQIGRHGTYPDFLPCSVYDCLYNEGRLSESGVEDIHICSMKLTFNAAVGNPEEDTYKCFCQYDYNDHFRPCDLTLQAFTEDICLGEDGQTFNSWNLDCQCSGGFENSFCDDPCNSEPCQNGGRCVSYYPWLDIWTFVCHCTHGFTGYKCDQTIMAEQKETTPVIHAEVCATATSNATTTFNSETAAMPSNISSKSPVEANKTTPSFTSPRQSTDDPCDSHHCMNNGKCRVAENGTLICQCTPSFTGEYCADEIPTTAPADDQFNMLKSVGMVIGVVLVVLIVLCIPLSIVLHRYYQAKRKLRASRRAYRTEHEIVERISSAHFTNPAYLSDKDVRGKQLQAGGNIPPPISPRPIISLPSGNGPGNDIYAEYIYVDRPGVHFPSSRKGLAGKGASDINGEYIYVVEPVGSSGRVSDVEPSRAKMVCPLPSAPPPSAGEYIYFDQSMAINDQSGPGEYIYVEEPTVTETSGERQTTYPSLFSSPKEPAPPMASVRPLPLEPPSIPTPYHDDSKKENENLYEELPEDNHTKSIDVVASDVDLDNDMYLRPDTIVM